jgi:pyridoxamine 5'-phosphate oxidase
MDKKEILEFITKNPVAYVATVEGNIPHVRALGTYRADENGIIFSMQSDKNVYKQVMTNPDIECCYFADGIQVRVTGRMVPVADIDLKKEIAEARPFLKPGVEQHGWDYVGVFVVENAKASVLNMGKPGPMTYTDL